MATTPDSFMMRSIGDVRSFTEEERPHPSYANSMLRPISLEVENVEKYKVMVKYLFTRISVQAWMPQTDPRLSGSTPYSYGNGPSPYGVLLRQQRGLYVTAPLDIHHDLLTAVQKINVEVAFTMATETTNMVLASLTPHQTELVLHDGAQWQIVDSLEEISRGATSKIKKFQYACIVRREKLILVWHDDISLILRHAQEVEGKLLSLIWGDGIPTIVTRDPFAHSRVTSRAPSIDLNGSRINFGSHTPSGYFPKKGPSEVVAEVSDTEGLTKDVEQQKDARESLARPLILTSSIFVGLGLCLLVVLLGLSVSKVSYEYAIDHNPMRIALLAATPFLGLFGLFFVIVIFSDIFQVIGPIKGVQSNSRFHSAIPPNIEQAEKAGFQRPPITIQMPVYKESLNGVIRPTVASLKEAISHYELCGGSANIFINDDGLQLLSDEDREERVNFYHDNNIGWVARPKHGIDGFVRPGKFKKASNMNYGLNISNKVEEKMVGSVTRILGKKNGGYISSQEEEELYSMALEEVLNEDGRAMAAGNIRIGEVILIVDSDTRVPVDCLLYGAAEMFLSPEVAIIQHSAGVMQVVHDYFENGITFFTDLIYTSVRFSIGCGEVAPFVGHNSFLRWSAIQSVAMKNNGGYDEFWSESHVSEDFDIALRLQIAGNVVRLASYHGDGFKEGVSLTIYDELARWEKYAYGCNELVFNPIYTWLYRGPLTPVFRAFLWSSIQLSSKATIIGYIATYYALASGLPLTLANYFIIGWFNGYLDTFYMESWNILLSLLVVFSLAGNICLAILRYRLGERSFFGALLENFKWMPMFCIFFSGVSFHVNLALLAQMFRIPMEWGATAKELEKSNFFKEVPKIFKTFKWMYLTVIPCIGGMIYLGCFAPKGWEIQGFTATVPLAMTLGAHVILPFVMNPALMIFNY